MKNKKYMVGISPLEKYEITFCKKTDEVELDNHINYIIRLYGDQLTRRDLFDEIDRFSEIKTVKGISNINFEKEIRRMLTALKFGGV